MYLTEVCKEPAERPAIFSCAGLWELVSPMFTNRYLEERLPC
jgi:hypothetical protein